VYSNTTYLTCSTTDRDRDN